MRKVLGFLFAMLLAIPAVQAGTVHIQPAPTPHAADHGHDMMMHHHHHNQTPAPPHLVHHECVGCIAPIDISHYRPAATPWRTVALKNRPANAAYWLTPLSAPEPPPPRLLA